MIYVTTRIALHAFEYDPYGEKPDWFLKAIKEGNAYEYAETKRGAAYAEIYGNRANVGDRIILNETGRIYVLSPKDFSREAKPLDKAREAASMFQERIQDAIHREIEK